MSKIRKVATHSGPFQADDVMCFSILKLVFGKDIQLIRSRIQKEYSEGDIVFDIGNEYIPEENKFDHHQKGGAGKRENGVPYSAVGLIWKHFGMQVVDSQEKWDYIDQNLIQLIDSNDCGVERVTDPEVKALYLPGMIEILGPQWNEGADMTAFNNAFFDAVKITDVVLNRYLAKADAIVQARQIVEKAIEESEDGIMQLDVYMPWKELLEQSQNPKAKDILYVTYRAVNGDWGCRCVPNAPGAFACKKDLPKKWAGLRDVALQDVSGVDDAIFCHQALFTCGAKTKEGLLEMIKQAVESQED